MISDNTAETYFKRLEHAKYFTREMLHLRHEEQRYELQIKTIS